MDPSQAQWQSDGNRVSTNLTLECRDGEQIEIKSGDFEYKGTDPQEAIEAFSNLIQHGLDQSGGEGS